MFRFSGTLFGIIFGVMFLIIYAKRLYNGTPIFTNLVDEFYMLLLLFVGFPLAAALILFAIFRIWLCSIDTSGISGRSYWGRRNFIPWSDIGNIGHISVEGIPAVLISSASSKKEVCAYILGADLSAFHAKLIHLAGSENPLTRYFRNVT